VDNCIVALLDYMQATLFCRSSSIDFEAPHLSISRLAFIPREFNACVRLAIWSILEGADHFGYQMDTKNRIQEV